METRDPHISREGDAPTPFTASEIEAGCPAGRVIRLRVDRSDGVAMIRLIRFVEVDETGAVQETQLLDLDGAELAKPMRSSSKWVDYQSHASFPTGITSIDRELRDTPLGRLNCVRYTVIEGNRTDVYWFDADRAGMPVRVETYEDGALVDTMQMIEDQVVE